MINLTGQNSQPDCNSLPNMLALCLMLSGTYYAKNYAGIIRLGQPLTSEIIQA